MDGVDRLHGGGRVLERARVDAPRAHVDELAQPERGLEFVAAFTFQDHAERSGAALRLRKGALHTEERAAPGHEIAHRGHELQHAVGLLGDANEHVVRKLGDDTVVGRRHHARVVLRLARGRVKAVHLVARRVCDPPDQPTDPNRLCGVVHVEHEHDDRAEDEPVVDDDGEARQRPAAGALAVDLAQDRHGVGERADEQSDGQLATAVVQDRPHDARRELAHRQLHSNEGQREHDARQGHQRCRRHGEDRLNGRGRAGHRRADDGPIERQQRQGQPDAGHHAGQRQQPQPSLGQVAQPEAPNPPHDCGHPRITPTTVGYPATPRPTRRPGSSGECRYGRRGALARRAARHRKCANRRRHSARRLASSPAGTGNAMTHSHG